MKKLIIPNGGMPFEGDDLKYMQDAFIEGFRFLLKAFSPDEDNFILQGVEITEDSGVTTLSPGLVVLSYEILEFPGASFPTSDINSKAIVLDVSYDAQGNEVFADNVSKDTYEVRKCKIATSTGVQEELQVTDSHQWIYLGEKIMQLPHLATKTILETDDYVSGDLIAFKQGAIVVLQGSINSSTGSFDGEIIPQLPEKLRPTSTIKTLIPLNDTDEDTFSKQGVLIIYPSGYVGLYHPDQSVIISNVSYVV